jgi:hypothetical protein
VPKYEDLDKWQQRQVKQFMVDNGVDEAAAMKELFPDPAPADAVDPAGEDDGAAPAVGKARLTKS